MAVRVHIPAPLRAATRRQRTLTLDGATVGEALAALVAAPPDVKPRRFDRGLLRRLVNVSVNDEDVRHPDGLATALGLNDSVTLMPSVSGGRA
ncbi:MAG: MoaD/ThiS family protein [Myxococcota bacterium]